MSAEPTEKEAVPLLPAGASYDPERGDLSPPPPIPETKHLPRWVAIAFSLNYTIGAGILDLPYDTYLCGYLLGPLVITMVAVLAYCTFEWIQSCMFRAEAITTLARRAGVNDAQLLNRPSEITDILQGTSKATLQSEFQLERNEWQLNEIIGMFCGRKVRLMYEVVFITVTLIALWAYCTLFAVSLTRVLGIPGISASCDMESSGHGTDCRGLYSFYVAIFFIWICIISLIDFEEQAGLQVFLCGMRYVVVVVMTVTSIGLMYSYYYYNGDDFVWDSSLPKPHYGRVSETPWSWVGLLYMIAVAAFAQRTQNAATDIANTLTIPDRRRLASVFAYSIGWSTVLYIITGVTVSLYFGDETESPCTLAWRYFTGFTENSGNDWINRIVAWFVVLFPAADIASAYPLNAITLANTIQGTLQLTHEQKQDYRIRAAVRIGVCIIPTFLAFLIWDFDFVATFSGLGALVALFVLPAWMEYRSIKMCEEITDTPDAHKTTFTNDWTSHRVWFIAMVVITVCATIGVIVMWAVNGVS